MDNNIRTALDIARQIAQQIEAGQTSGVVRAGTEKPVKDTTDWEEVRDRIHLFGEDGPPVDGIDRG